MRRTPQGSIVSTDLFNFFINNLDDGAKQILVKFMDKMKVGAVAYSLEGHAAIQRELNRLERRADRNLVQITKEKRTLASGEK